MSKKISEMLIKTISKNFGWKVFSLTLAIVMWFVVMNTINPTEIQSFSVNITLLNKEKLADNGYVVINQEELENTRVEVKVKATRPALDELSKNKKNIKASIDLQQFDVLYPKDIKDAITVNISPSLPLNYVYSYELVSFTPGNAEVKLDNIVEVTKEVVVDRIGESMSGYIAMQPEVTPKYITVKGASSAIENIGSVRVAVDLSNISADMTVTETPVVYDASNNEMNDFILSDNEVEVYIGVNKYGQIPISAPIIQGNPADNYKVISARWEPKYVEVIGGEEEIAGLSKIELAPISVENENKDKVVKIDLRPYLVDTNLSIKNGTPNQVTVTINIASEIVKDIEIPESSLTITGLDDEYAVSVPNSITISVKGLETALNSLKVEDLKCSVDAASLAEGIFNLPIQIELPDGVSLSGDNVVSVVITKKNENPVEITSEESSTDETASEETSENSNFQTEESQTEVSSDEILSEQQ